MIHNILNNDKLVLASESPRRKLLLESLGLKPLIVPANIAEPLSKERAHKQAVRHARNKAIAVRSYVDGAATIVAADTLVVLDELILGKPASAEEAASYLRLLSGRIHNVYTGLCVIRHGELRTAYERSKVRFKDLSEQEIADYLKTGEPFDKAGAYGIQGYGAQFIRDIQGCYFNVMGFPINLFYNILCGEVNE
ncbi:MAG TPA: Maf family protein [Candidatus Cloacimonadota bacterium]|mgnify:CR=1 FL=1|nr:Maf family protein [Candidatus Cloacimonadota bacterium]